MTLLIVTRSTPLHPGAAGMERVAWDIGRGLSQFHAVEVLTTRIPGRPAVFEEDGLLIRTLPKTAPGRYSLAWWVASTRFSLDGYKAVLSVSAGAAAIALTNREARVVFQAHGTAYEELKAVVRSRSRRWVFKVLRFAYWIVIDNLTYRRAAAVVAASHNVAAALHRRPYSRAWRHNSLVVIQNGVDDRHFRYDAFARQGLRRHLGLEASDRAVLTVSRLAHQKGVDRVIKAIAVGEADLRLLIAGDGPAKAELESQARRLGIGDRVIFLGPTHYDDLPALYSAADVFVFPVRTPEREGMPLSVLEALVSGLPVVVPARSKWPPDLTDRLSFCEMESPAGLGKVLSRTPSRTESPQADTSQYGLERLVSEYRRVLQQVA